MFKTAICIIVLLAAGISSSARWKGDKFLYAEAAYLKEMDYVNSSQWMLNAGIEYIGNPLKSFGCELNIWHYKEPGNTALGLGLRPMTKYYLWRTKRFRVFIEVKGGLIYVTPDFPDGGSQFNFTFSSSAGGDIRISDRTRLMLAARYAHMSNWNLYGADNNPTWDGLGYVAGVIWNINNWF